MYDVKSIIKHVEELRDDAVVPFYKELYTRILGALRFDDIRAAMCIAESGISGAEEDRSWDAQVSSVIYALDGTFEYYGIPM